VSDNHVTLVGNLTDDPELRYTTAGVAVANFRLAVNPRLWDGETWKDGEPSFFRVNVWRRSTVEVEADDVAASLRFAPAAPAKPARKAEEDGRDAEAEPVMAGAMDDVPF
jgi:single-strand DNA-binding protein